MPIYLARDILDTRVLDRKGEPVGHADGVVIALDGDAQPRVIAIEVGSVTQARRLGERIGRWVERLSKRWGRMRPNPYRIQWRDLTIDAHDLRVDALASEVPTRAWEHWLRDKIVRRIPGS